MHEKTMNTYGSGDISTGDTLNGRIEVVERLALDDLSTDLTANTEGGEATLNNHQSANKAVIVSHMILLGRVKVLLRLTGWSS